MAEFINGSKWEKDIRRVFLPLPKNLEVRGQFGLKPQNLAIVLGVNEPTLTLAAEDLRATI